MSPIGLDHFARPATRSPVALRGRRLRRNFQGYTADPAAALIGLGASAICACRRAICRTRRASAPMAMRWRRAARRRPRHRAHREDRLRRDIIDRLMCDLAADLGVIAARHGAAERFASEREALADLARDGMVRLEGDRIEMVEECRMLVRAVAAVFDTRLAHRRRPPRRGHLEL